jgi:hypothetical protein
VELAKSLQGKDMILKRLSHNMFFFIKTQDYNSVQLSYTGICYRVDPLLDFLVVNSVQ